MFTAQELRKKWLLDRLLTYELYVGSPGRGCEKGRRYHQEIANLKMKTSEDYYQYDDDDDDDDDHDDETLYRMAVSLMFKATMVP